MIRQRALAGLGRDGGFQAEEGAAEFSKFIRRLGQDNINNDDPVFRAKVTAWLDELAEDPELRKKSFLAVLGAAASCEDRISLVFNEMNKIKLTHDVEKGLYDDKLPELIALARGMFHLDVLEKIAREKVSTLNFVDEIEVYLAYQVKLREQLDLPINAEKMRYFGVAHVTAEDLAIAEKRVKAEENAHFADYLASEWGPWQAVVKRLDPEGAEKVQDDLIESIETRFPQELEALAIERGFDPKDPDVSRILGPEVSKKLTAEFNRDLTRGILEKQGLTNALKPKWRSKGKGKA